MEVVVNSLSTDISPETGAEELAREVLPLINNLSCGKPIYDSPLFVTPFHIVQYIENSCFTFLSVPPDAIPTISLQAF